MGDPNAPMRVLDYRRPPSPLPPLPHSGFGQAATVLPVLTLLCFVALVHFRDGPETVVAMLPTFWITGMVAAIIGLFQRRRRPLFAVIGLAANLAVAAGMVLWMLFTFHP